MCLHVRYLSVCYMVLLLIIWVPCRYVKEGQHEPKQPPLNKVR